MKRLFSIAITLTAALGLAACGVAPAAPTGLVLTGAEQTSLSFSWNASAGADSYKWRLVKGVTSAAEGSVTQTSVSIPGLEAGTEYTFSVRAVSAAGMSVWSNLGASTQKAPAPEPQPGGKVQCTDAPIVVGYSGTPVLGKSGLIRVLDAKGSEVDRIDLSDIATVDLLPDGTMIPKGADADNGKIAIGNDYAFNSFMDALHSSNYRAVHYTPLRINGNTLEIKLHNEALDFGAAYTVKIDDAVAGIPAEDISFTTKAAPADEATIRVAVDGSADFCTVQGALSYVSAKIKKDAPVTIEIANGTYNVELYANAFFTSGRGFESDMQEGAMDVAYVFANDVKCPVVGQIATATEKNGEYALEVTVTDGKLTLGLGKEKAGTNWHTIQIKSLTLKK